MDFTTWLISWTVILSGSFAALYTFFSVRFSYWKKKGVPYLEPSFPIGNVHDMVFSRKTLGLVHADIYTKVSGYHFAGIYQVYTPMLVLVDPEVVQSFLDDDFQHFHDHGWKFDEAVEPLGANLYQINGKRWDALRLKMSPTFTSDKVQTMFQDLLDCGFELERYLREPAIMRHNVEVKDVMSRFTIDVIATCVFGIQCNCLRDRDADFSKWAKRLFDPSIEQKFRNLLYLLMPSFAMFLRISNLPRRVSRYFIRVVEETIKYRERHRIKRHDFMELLIKLRNSGTVDEGRETSKAGNTKLTTLEVAAQAFMFFIAGFETSATTMSFALYELALNPDIQRRVRKEIDTVLSEHGGKITYEAIQKMSFLDKTISETLRKHPPVPFLTRECTKDYKIKNSDVTIDKGTLVIVPIMGLHYDPKYFADPHKFDPERFSEEEMSKRHKYTYLPFGEGPRICIGINFAFMQIKVGLVSILRKYEVRVCSKTSIPLKYDTNTTILFIEGGTWLQIRERVS